MTDENKTLWQEFDRLQHQFNQHKMETDANMNTLEANLEKSLADNRAALSKLVVVAATVLGLFMTIMVLFLTGAAFVLNNTTRQNDQPVQVIIQQPAPAAEAQSPAATVQPAPPTPTDSN